MRLFLVMASVLTVQALFFADGGLLALGCNIWNLGSTPATSSIRSSTSRGSEKLKVLGRILVASIVSVVAACNLARSRSSDCPNCPSSSALSLMQQIHLAIGLIEGFVADRANSTMCSAPDQSSECGLRPLRPRNEFH